MPHDPATGVEGTFTPDNLIAGEALLRSRDYTITGGTFVRGSVMGIITVGGKVTLSASAAGDGSEVPKLILAKDVDASVDDVVAPCYLAGEFNERALTFGAGHDADSVKAAFLGTPVFIQPSVSA